MRLRGCDRRVFERLRSDVCATAGGRKMPVLELSDDEAQPLIRLL
jgi:hypothetical protein